MRFKRIHRLQKKKKIRGVKEFGQIDIYSQTLPECIRFFKKLYSSLYETISVCSISFKLLLLCILGASSDFDGATKIAKMMVTRFGMSDKVKF